MFKRKLWSSSVIILASFAHKQFNQSCIIRTQHCAGFSNGRNKKHLCSIFSHGTRGQSQFIVIIYTSCTSKSLKLSQGNSTSHTLFMVSYQARCTVSLAHIAIHGHRPYHVNNISNRFLRCVLRSWCTDKINSFALESDQGLPRKRYGITREFDNWFQGHSVVRSMLISIVSSSGQLESTFLPSGISSCLQKVTCSSKSSKTKGAYMSWMLEC